MKRLTKILASALLALTLTGCSSTKIPESLQEYDFKTEPMSVHNDKTGKWKYATIAKTSDPNDWAVEYAKTFMEDGEVHAVINFANSTTTRLVRNGDSLQVQTYEYVDGEEHDADMLFTGMPLDDVHLYDLK